MKKCLGCMPIQLSGDTLLSFNFSVSLKFVTASYVIFSLYLVQAIEIFMITSRGGTHMLRHTGMCRPNGLLFQQKSFDMGPILVKKILRRGSHFTKIVKKIVKSAHFEVEKPLEMGPDLRKFRKKTLNQRFFEGEKSLDMGRGFRPRAAHPVKN